MNTENVDGKIVHIEGNSVCNLGYYLAMFLMFLWFLPRGLCATVTRSTHSAAQTDKRSANT